MAWYGDYWARHERLLDNGLLVLVRGARIDPGTGFIGVYFDANESDLLRSNADREFELHLTVGYASDYFVGVAEDCVDRINHRWRGRLVRLKVSWIGGGGSIQLAHDDLFVRDPDISWMHRRGWYGNGINCLPRQLHVSL